MFVSIASSKIGGIHTLINCARIFVKGSFSASEMYVRSGRWPTMEE
jgi:hypothetical protein